MVWLHLQQSCLQGLCHVSICVVLTGVCERCGYISSNPVCKACVMLEGLNKGLPRLGIGKTHKERRKVGAANDDQMFSVIYEISQLYDFIKITF